MDFLDIVLVSVFVLFVLNVMRQGIQAIRTREMAFDALGRKGKITGQLVLYYGVARIVSGIVALLAVVLLFTENGSLAFLIFVLAVGLYLAPVSAMSVRATNEASNDKATGE